MSGCSKSSRSVQQCQWTNWTNFFLFLCRTRPDGHGPRYAERFRERRDGAVDLNFQCSALVGLAVCCSLCVCVMSIASSFPGSDSSTTQISQESQTTKRSRKSLVFWGNQNNLCWFWSPAPQPLATGWCATTTVRLRLGSIMGGSRCQTLTPACARTWSTPSPTSAPTTSWSPLATLTRGASPPSIASKAGERDGSFLSYLVSARRIFSIAVIFVLPQKLWTQNSAGGRRPHLWPKTVGLRPHALQSQNKSGATKVNKYLEQSNANKNQNYR